MSDDRSGALRAAKLRALAGDRVGDGAESAPLADGAAMLDGSSGWVLLDQVPRLGPALAWAVRAGATDLHVVVGDAPSAGVLARRAALVATRPTVWWTDGSALVSADPAPALGPADPPDAPDLVAVLSEAGLEIAPGDGTWIGEVRGLEVARVVDGPDGPVLEVGVGRFDRELTEMAQAHLTPADRVHRAAEIVAEQRRPGAVRHPVNQMVRERWLRSLVVGDPTLVGADSLRPVASVEERTNLKDAGVASAVGVDADGADVVVTCSTGVDLDLVPSAADDRAWWSPDARLLLVLPRRDALPVTEALAGALDSPAEVVALDDLPWPD